MFEHVSEDLLALAAKVLGEAEIARGLQAELVRAYAGLIDGRYTPGTSVEA